MYGWLIYTRLDKAQNSKITNSNSPVGAICSGTEAFPGTAAFTGKGGKEPTKYNINNFNVLTPFLKNK